MPTKIRIFVNGLSTCLKSAAIGRNRAQWAPVPKNVRRLAQGHENGHGRAPGRRPSCAGCRPPRGHETKSATRSLRAGCFFPPLPNCQPFVNLIEIYEKACPALHTEQAHTQIGNRGFPTTKIVIFSEPARALLYKQRGDLFHYPRQLFPPAHGGKGEEPPKSADFETFPGG